MEVRQQENCRRCHQVCQQPEEQVLVADELVAAEGIGCRQCHQDADDHVHQHVGDGVQVSHVPAWAGEYLHVMLRREVLRPQGKSTEYLVIGLEGHVEQPIDGQEHEHDVGRHQASAPPLRQGRTRLATPSGGRLCRMLAYGVGGTDQRVGHLRPPHSSCLFACS
ncbi:hypothetical protein [Modicisalibacter xianhensis]|uniref:hypothetical protein n=1 Tax=Modicisalibacter xianhensis TaxID=442341 RepID=UPI003BF4A753